MAKNAHLTYDERLTIQSSLADRLSFKAIGLIIGKDPSTVAKEVKNHIKIVETSAYNPCLYSKTCKHNRDVCKPCSKKFSQNCHTCSEACYKSCAEYVEGHCLTVLKPPYVCNGCTERHTAPFTFLGNADYVSHNGEQPVNFIWNLHTPIPAELLPQANKSIAL